MSKVIAIGLLISSVLVASCGGGGSAGPKQPTDSSQSDTTLNSSACAQHIDELRQSIPVTFSNTDSSCDYYIAGTVSIQSDVIIEAGTVFVMAENAQFIVSNGSLDAQGTPEQPIEFSGQSPIVGFWDGITLYENRRSDLASVRITDGGKGLGSGLEIVGGKVSIIDTWVSNSYGNGLTIDSYGFGSAYRQNIEVEEFRANRFFGNQLAGLEIDSTAVFATEVLDEETDYIGDPSPNGIPRVLINSLSLNGSEQLILPGIGGASYDVGYIDTNSGSSLTLLAGVELNLSADSYYGLRGELVAKGTAEDPVVIRGLPDADDNWSRFFAAGGINATYLHMFDGGQPTNNDDATTYGMLRLSSGDIDIRDSKFGGSNSWGITCIASIVEEAKIFNLENNEFIENALGDMHSSCLR